ncbi:putative disease resistance protein RGA4 [Typha latifolia]|uniref:putative disease resistance protein RGA4 n=1 Tax=Typha latifolia TaxID=4733 RepID=UPI003C300E62
MEAAAALDILSAKFDVILHRLRTDKLEDLAFQFEVEKEIVEISRRLVTIRSLVQEKERKSASEEEARIWLTEVQHVIYEVEDLIDELESEGLNSSSPLNEVRGASFVGISYRSYFGNSISGKILELSKKLERLGGVNSGVVILTQGGRGRLELPPSPCPLSGRDSAVVDLVNKLFDGSNQNDHQEVVSAMFLPIFVVGHGGLGKTALVKHVYDHKQVQDHFNLRMWVSVSACLVENSNISDGIIESISPDEDPTLTNLKLADVNNLKEILRGKRFLLVLDDVWHDEHSNEWEHFFCSLLAGDQMGSKLLITTRNSDVAKMQRYDLDILSPDDSWRLFENYFGGNRLSDDLKKVGREIVELLGGFPRAIQTIASLLSQQLDVGFWGEILETCQAQRVGNNDITELAMKIAYQHLPPDLKQCLVYCSLFPRGYKLVKANIIHTWVAGGFILPDEKKKVEHIASEYFDHLLSMSFFHSVGGRYIMHASVHKLTPRILVSSCSRLHWLTEIPTSAIHLSLFSENLKPSEFKDLGRFSSLRSLIFLRRNKSAFDHLTEELLLALKSLRVLDLSHTDITELPNSVGELKHLRLLDLSYTEIQGLPETMSRLHKLEVLGLLECHMIFSLPAWVKKMASLRYLKASADLVRTLGRNRRFAIPPEPGRIQRALRLWIWRTWRRFKPGPELKMLKIPSSSFNNFHRLSKT